MRSQVGLDQFHGVFRRHDRDEFELDEIAELKHPLLEQTRGVALHELKAAVEIRFYPATDIGQPVWQTPAMIADMPVNGDAVAIAKTFDHHE